LYQKIHYLSFLSQVAISHHVRNFSSCLLLSFAQNSILTRCCCRTSTVKYATQTLLFAWDDCVKPNKYCNKVSLFADNQEHVPETLREVPPQGDVTHGRNKTQFQYFLLIVPGRNPGRWRAHTVPTVEPGSSDFILTSDTPRQLQYFTAILPSRIPIAWSRVFFFGATAPPVGEGLLIHEVSRSHNDEP